MDEEMTNADSDSFATLDVKATFRLLVPANAAGSIIGQKGEFIRKVREKCRPGAYLRVPEMPQSSERLVLITCELDDIPIIIRQLCRPIFKALKDDHNIPEEHWNEILLLVNSQQAGRIVGKGGEKLKTIRMDTGCSRFKIYKDRLPFSEERVCEIKGSEDSVALAVQSALEILATHPLDHDYQRYMPTSDTFVNSEGEWGGYKRFARGPSFNSSTSGHYETFSRPYDRPVYEAHPSTAYNYSRTHSDRTVQAYPISRDHSRDRDYGRDRSPLRSTGEHTHKDIYVDDCYTKHVIGSKGSQIAKIRRLSGADIQIAKDDTVQNGERKISISGRRSEIDSALKLINEAIADKIKIDRKNSSGVGNVPCEFDYVNELFDRICAVIPFSDIHDNDTTVTEEEVIIPNTDTATVIGPKGIRIKDMRNYTKCAIKIQDDKDVTGDERRVNVRGTPRQIHRAIFMIKNITKVMR